MARVFNSTVKFTSLVPATPCQYGTASRVSRRLPLPPTGASCSSRQLRPALYATTSSVDEIVVAEVEVPITGLLEMRVGKILSCGVHEQAPELYVVKLDIGQDQPRTICSSLVRHLSKDELIDTLVIGLLNVKTRHLRGVMSTGIILTAGDRANDHWGPIRPPQNATPGDRVKIGDDVVVYPATVNRIRRRKVWETVQPWMFTDSEGVATCNGKALHVESGLITCPSMPNHPID